ncbi:WD40 repeat-like protein [Serendipita vermifera]|nr:WD40 repeat-like protein [Serendipita vermifera]
MNKFPSRRDPNYVKVSQELIRIAHIALNGEHLSLQDEAILQSLKPKDVERDSPHDECMEGTRQDILQEIESWATNFDAPNILWLKGYPGSGKSAIASSLVSRFYSSKRLGSWFFFQRDKVTTMSTRSLWRTVAYDLACRYPRIRASLIAKLQGGDVGPMTTNINNMFRHLIHEPLMASENIPVGKLPVIIIDALDECGGLDGRYSQEREKLMHTIELWSHVPRVFKLVVTSRSETDVDELLESIGCYTIEIPTGPAVNFRTSEDIRTLLTHELCQIARRYCLPSLEWPGSSVVDQLTLKAAGLFIWAKTATRFIAYGEPEEQLNKILRGNTTGSMSDLYSRILTTSFPNPSGRVIDAFRSIVGSIILAQTPLSAAAIIRLLSIDQGIMQHICIGLRSVLDSGDVLRIKHHSFVDFVLDQSQCPGPFLVLPRLESRRMTLACLRAMSHELRFNICNLESSHNLNSDVPDLSLRIRSNISEHLLYSSSFWADHLVETNCDMEVWISIQYFMRKHFLFWLEVLSLCQRVSIGSRMLHLLVDWIQNNGQDFTMASEMDRFTSAFANVIAQSAPHIYLSALPFSPQSSAIYKTYMPLYPNTLRVASGGQQDWAAILNVLSGHIAPILSIAFSPDGRYIASGSEDHTVRVWNAETGEDIALFEGHRDTVNAVSFSSDSRLIVSGSDDCTVRIWDIETNERILGPLKGHKDVVTSVIVSNDGRHIASGSWDKTIRLWDLQSGRKIGNRFEGHMDVVSSIAFSANGCYIVSGSWDKTIRVWDIQTGTTIIGPFEGHMDMINSVTISPDGCLIASGSWDETIRVWSVDRGEEVMRPLEGHADMVTSVAFSPDGNYIISGSEDDTVRLWDIHTGEEATSSIEVHKRSVTSVMFSPNGRRIASGSYDKKILVWDTQMSGQLAKPFEGHTGYINSVVFSPDGRKIASGSSDRTIWIWDSTTGSPLVGPFEGHTNSITCVAFSPDGVYIVSGSADHTLRLWNTTTGNEVREPFQGHNSSINSVAFSPDGKRIVSGSSGKSIRIWNAQTGETIVGSFHGHTGLIHSVAFSPDGKRIVSGSWDNTIRLWNADTGKMIQAPLKGHTNEVRSVSFSPDGRKIVSGSSDETILVWDAETGAQLLSSLEGHGDAVTSVAFSPDGKYIVSGSWDTTIIIWDAETGKQVERPFEGHTDIVTSVSLSSDGKRIVSASQDKTIRVWTATGGKDIASMLNDAGCPMSLVPVSPISEQISSESDSGTSRGWSSDSVRSDEWEYQPSVVTIDTTGSMATTGVSVVPINTWKMWNGWALGSNSELLFWVPPELRDGLLKPNTLCIVGNLISTQLDLTSFVHGESWTDCRLL